MAKSPEGKARSARNAVTHGLLSKWLSAEEAEQARLVMVALVDELEPRGAMEAILVERLAWLAARLRHATAEALRAELQERREPQTITARSSSKTITTRAAGKARDLGAIARYESSLQRQFLRIWQELVKVQAARESLDAVKPKGKMGL